MAYELKDGQFTLHKQDPAKKKKENSPDFFGSAMVNGVELRLSGWGKISKESGKFYISGYISPPQDQAPASPEEIDTFMSTEQTNKATAPEINNLQTGNDDFINF